MDRLQLVIGDFLSLHFFRKTANRETSLLFRKSASRETSLLIAEYLA